MSAASATAVAPEPPRVADRECEHRAADNDGRCRAVLGWQRSRSLDAIIRTPGSHWARHGFVVCLIRAANHSGAGRPSHQHARPGHAGALLHQGELATRMRELLRADAVALAATAG